MTQGRTPTGIQVQGRNYQAEQRRVDTQKEGAHCCTLVSAEGSCWEGWCLKAHSLGEGVLVAVEVVLRMMMADLNSDIPENNIKFKQIDNLHNN